MNPATWLLTDPSPCLRYLVLRELFDLQDDHPEVLELTTQRMQDNAVLELINLQEVDGSWKTGSGLSGKLVGSTVLTTAYVLARLGFMGFDSRYSFIARGAEFVFSQQKQDGSWILSGEYDDLSDPDIYSGRDRYSMMPLQTAYPLRGLAVCGYATDPRAERAYEWLRNKQLEDGAWPTGIAEGVYGYVAGYRRLPHSRWGCRSNTTAAVICLSLHPERRKQSETRKALDLLLGIEKRDAFAVGHEVSRLVGAEPAHGFISYFAKFDVALVLNLCSLIEASIDDDRISSNIKFVESLRRSTGLWDYQVSPRASRWVSYDLMRTIKKLGLSTDWFNLEPTTPFQAYPRKLKRF